MFVHRKGQLQVCEGQIHFARMYDGEKSPLPCFHGVRGPEVVRSLLEIEATFEKNLQSKSESTVGQSTSCEKKDEKTVDKESCTKRDNDGKAPGPSLPLTQQVWFSEERMIELLLLWGNIPMWNVSFCAAERERYIILNISRTLSVTSI